MMLRVGPQFQAWGPGPACGLRGAGSEGELRLSDGAGAELPLNTNRLARKKLALPDGLGVQFGREATADMDHSHGPWPGSVAEPHKNSIALRPEALSRYMAAQSYL